MLCIVHEVCCICVRAAEAEPFDESPPLSDVNEHKNNDSAGTRPFGEVHAGVSQNVTF